MSKYSRATRLPALFWRLAAEVAVSNLADGIRAVALPLLVAAMTRDPALVAGLGVAQTLPHLIVGLPAGIAVDRLDRRKVFLAGHLVQAVVFLAVVAALLAETISIPLLYCAAIILGASEALRDTTAATLVPSIVQPDQLDAANARLVTAEFGMQQLIGPALGSTLFAVALLLPFATSAALLVAGAVLAAGVYVQRATGAVPVAVESEIDGVRTRSRLVSFRDEISAGLTYISRHSLLRATLALGVILTLTDAAWFSILVLFLQDELGIPAEAYGLFLAVGALGGIAGGLWAARLITRLGTALALRGSVATAGVMQLLMGVTGSVVVAVVALGVGNMAFAVWNTASTSLRQGVTPDRILGRVNAAWRTAFMGAAPLGFIVGGVLADRFGLRAAFLIGAPVVLAAALLSLSITRTNVVEARGARQGPT